MSTIEKCSAVEANMALDLGDECQLVDVREYSEFATERVNGATLVPLSAFERNLSLIDRSRPVYLMCRAGNRAAQAAERLLKLGFSDLKVIDGGLQAWAASGLYVERGAGNVWSLERQVRFAAGSIVVVGVFLSIISSWFVLLSGFVGAGLMFSAFTNTCGMGMILARMPWNQRPKAGSNEDCAAS
jgi:rhodanese-related sulfurtransferase